MNNINIRNVLLAIGAIVLVILGMNILSTFIGAIVPIIITAIVAFIAGRLTAGRSMGHLFRTAQTAGSTVMAAASRIVEEKTPVTVQGKVNSPAAKPVEKESPAPAAETPNLKNPELLDPTFEIKTPEQIAAESQRLEAEASQKAAALDPKALIEERKKRLLNNQGGQS
ncbi:MAG: hypothetical protein GC179_11560 [Anaerolineaceae bacterium]|nr:hypothetical protein [Anaerolineaceae bacterium]